MRPKKRKDFLQDKQANIRNDPPWMLHELHPTLQAVRENRKEEMEQYRKNLADRRKNKKAISSIVASAIIFTGSGGIAQGQPFIHSMAHPPAQSHSQIHKQDQDQDKGNNEEYYENSTTFIRNDTGSTNANETVDVQFLDLDSEPILEEDNGKFYGYEVNTIQEDENENFETEMASTTDEYGNPFEVNVETNSEDYNEIAIPLDEANYVNNDFNVAIEAMNQAKLDMKNDVLACNVDAVCMKEAKENYQRKIEIVKDTLRNKGYPVDEALDAVQKNTFAQDQNMAVTNEMEQERMKLKENILNQLNGNGNKNSNLQPKTEMDNPISQKNNTSMDMSFIKESQSILKKLNELKETDEGYIITYQVKHSIEKFLASLPFSEQAKELLMGGQDKEKEKDKNFNSETKMNMNTKMEENHQNVFSDESIYEENKSLGKSALDKIQNAVYSKDGKTNLLGIEVDTSTSIYPTLAGLVNSAMVAMGAVGSSTGKGDNQNEGSENEDEDKEEMRRRQKRNRED